MHKRKKTILYAAGGVIGFVILVLLVRFIINSQYTSRIPELSDPGSFSQPVREQIADALHRTRRHPSADNLGGLGMVYHSSANYEQAAQCYRLAIRKSRRDWLWNYYHGYLSMEMGESGAVVEDFTAVLEKNPDMHLAWYYIGEAYKNLRENERAEEAFGKITADKDIGLPAKEATRIDHFNLSTYAMFQLSRIYSETGRYELAENTLKEIIQDDRTFGPAYRLLGNVYSMTGNVDASEWYGVRANDLLVFSPPVDTLVDRLVLLSRSELYLLKKIDEAERGIYDEWTLRLVDHALHYMPDNEYLISKALKIYLWVGLKDQAIAITDRHISHFRENFTEMYNIGSLMFMNGLYPQSQEYLAIALELKPDDAEVQKKLALCAWYAGDKQKAHEMLDELIQENGDDPDVLADIADILFFNLRDREKAISYLERLKQVAPSHPKALKMSAGIAEEKGRYREAIRLYEASFRGDPEDLTTIKYLGNLLFSQKLYGRSISHYREALEYHPNDPYFLEKLGTLLVACPDTSLRNYHEGREYLERAFIHVSSRPNTLVSAGRSLAWTYAKLGDKENAISTITQTIIIGRREGISTSYLAELENLLKTFQALGN